MTDRELLQQALDVLTSVAITKRSGVTDNGSAVLPFEVLIECADMVSAIGTRLAQPKKEWVGFIGVMDIAQSSLQLVFKTREQANEVKAELEGNNT